MHVFALAENDLAQFVIDADEAHTQLDINNARSIVASHIADQPELAEKNSRMACRLKDGQFVLLSATRAQLILVTQLRIRIGVLLGLRLIIMKRTSMLWQNIV